MGRKACVLFAIFCPLSVLIFHVSSGGGADGSMLLFPDIEPLFAANNGIIDSVDALIPFLSSGKFPTITAGDMIQFAATVAVGLCPVSQLLQSSMYNH